MKENLTWEMRTPQRYDRVHVCCLKYQFQFSTAVEIFFGVILFLLVSFNLSSIFFTFLFSLIFSFQWWLITTIALP